jgi:putative peptidoglycan lipid II flippase
MIGYSVRQVVLQGFYAIKETKTPVRINIFILCLNMALTALFVKIWREDGIALAYSVAGIISAFTQTYYLKKKVGSIRKLEIQGSLWKMVLCCIVMVIVIDVARILFEHSVSVEIKQMQLAELLLLVGIGGLTYVGLAIKLKMKELDAIIVVLKRKFLRK